MSVQPWKVREMVLKHSNSYKVGEKYGVVEHRAPGRHELWGARGESLGEVVLKVLAGGVMREKIHS